MQLLRVLRTAPSDSQTQGPAYSVLMPEQGNGFAHPMPLDLLLGGPVTPVRCREQLCAHAGL